MPDDPYDAIVSAASGPDPNRQALADPRVKGFLDKISQAEGADYNTLVGGKKINDLSRHPSVVGLRTSAGPSTAFGRYQITGTTDKSKLAKYSHLDYSPENQDLRAVELLRQTKALDALQNGDEQTAIKRAGSEWASLPGSTLPGRKRPEMFQQKPSSAPNPYDGIVNAATPPDAIFQTPEIQAAEQKVASTRQRQSQIAAQKEAATPDPYDAIVAAATPQAAGRGAGMARAQGTTYPMRKSYDTRLTPQEESQFQSWKQQYAPNDTGTDYDLRGAFKAGLTPDPKTGHWPDTFKKPNHPTFSNESQYAVGDAAKEAGHWQGDKFIPPSRRRAQQPDSLGFTAGVGGARAKAQPAVSVLPRLGQVPDNTQSFLHQEGQQPMAQDPRSQVARQVESEYGSLAGNIQVPLTDPIGAITKPREQMFNEEVDRRLTAQQRANTPEVIAARKELGATPAAVRGPVAAANKFGGSALRSLSGVTSLLGIAPNQLSNFLEHRAQVAIEGSDAPLNEQGELIKRSLPEKASEAVTSLGLTIAQLVLLKKATGLGLGNIMAAETALQTSKLPLKERAVEIAKSKGMGEILEQHLSRPVSAALFGGPTAVQSGLSYAQGNVSLEDALLQTGVQAGAGAIMGGKPKGEPPLQRGTDENRGLSTVSTVPNTEGVAPQDRPTDQARQVESVAQVPLSDRAREDAIRQLTPQPGAVPSEPIRHVDLQSRKVRGEAAGQFKKETKAEAEARRAQVSQSVTPELQTEPRTPNEPATSTPEQPPIAEAAPVATSTPEVSVPSKAASEALARNAQSPNGPETHPTVRRFLGSDYKDKILTAIGSDAEPLNPTELGGIKASSVSFRKPDGSVVTVEDAAFSDSKPTYGSKRDGFVVSRSKPTQQAVPPSAVSEVAPMPEASIPQSLPRGWTGLSDSSQAATIVKKAIPETAPQTESPPLGGVEPQTQPVEAAKVETSQQKERSFPKTLEATGREGGTDRVYDFVGDKEAVAKADERISEDPEAARQFVLSSGDANTPKGKERVATGLRLADQLAKEAETSKDPIESASKHAQAIELYTKTATDLTEAGQTVQAASLAQKYSQTGAALEVVRIAKRNSETPRAKDISDVRNMARRQDDLETRLAEVQKQIETLQAKGKGTTKTTQPRAKVETLTDRLARMESEARARLEARAELAKSQTVGPTGQRGSGINPVDVAASIADWTTIGAAKIARGGLNFAAWSKEMISEFGDAIKPHLDKIFMAAHKMATEQRGALKEESAQRNATKAGMTLEDFKQQRYELQVQKRQARLDMDRKFRELDKRAQRGPIKRTADAIGSVLTNSLLSYHGLLNILGTMTAKEAINTALRVPESGFDLAERGVARAFGKQIPRASAGLSPRQLGRAAKSLVTEAPGNVAKAFMAKPSEVMPQVHDGPLDSPKLNLALDFMSRHYASKEALVRTPVYNLERSNQASIMAHNDITDGIIKRSQLNSRIDDYLNGRASIDGPLNKKYAASLADQAADYEIKSRNPTPSGTTTPSAKAARVKEMMTNPTQLIDSQAMQYADKEVYANPLGPKMQKIQEALNAGGPIPRTLIQPFFKRPVNAFNDLLYSYTGLKAIKEGAQAVINAMKGQEWTPAERQSFNRAMARGGTIYGLAALGAALAGRGLLTSGNDKQHPGSLKVGNSYYAIGNKPVIGWAIVAGATARLDGVDAVPAAVGKMVIDHPLLKGLKNVIDATQEGYQAAQGKFAKAGKAATSFAGKSLGRVVPTPLAATAETMDTQNRDTRGITGPLKSRIPFVRQQLPAEGPKERGSAFDPFLAQPIRLKPRGKALRF